MSGTLYVVATPIGNLEDITLRALRVLREVSLIAAEDTRRTAKLLQRHGLATPTISFHEHNLRRRVPELMRQLASGESIALVSDAGTPLMSDPGLELVQACLESNISVEPIPGPSAHLTALVASGFPSEPVTLFGFAPSKATARKQWLERLSAVHHTIVFLETPHRIRAILAEASAILGDRPLTVGRELTKVHQEFMRGTAAQLAERLNIPRGEFTVVVGPATEATVSEADSDDPVVLDREFRQMTDSGALTRRQAIAELSKRHRRSAREIYALLERAKAPVP